MITSKIMMVSFTFLSVRGEPCVSHVYSDLSNALIFSLSLSR